MNLDLYIFNWINGQAKKYKWLDTAGVFFARYLPFLMIIFLAVFALAVQDIKIIFYPLLCGLFSRFIINELIYFFYKRKRPASLDNANVLVPIPRHPSFPSGHASFFFGVSFSLLFFNPILAYIFIVIFTLNAIARIFCGVHWPSDILAGILAGGVSAIFVNYLLGILT